MTSLQFPDLPLSAYHAEFRSALAHATLLLEAEPGAGKSTLAPLWSLAEVPAGQCVWLVQPRVLAAQALAQRLAQLLDEKVGQTVGFQVPFDTCASRNTRLLLMTPGILLQHLLQDPTLENVAIVMLDEIHERSVNQDTAWAWLQEAQILRDDLRVILMSATPDPALQRSISPRLFAPGRCFAVTTQYQPPKQTAQRYGEKLDEQLLRALASFPDWHQTTVLVFLPGWREIEACAATLAQRFPAQKVLRLHSRVAAREQVTALDARQGPRIILSTNIAETSLTIADVTLVIDSGLVRRAEYEQRTGISRLRNARISQASADQRRGRAGRVQAGHCIRLWSQDQPLAVADLPEIRTTDYLPLMLRLAHWGSDSRELNWLEAPNSLALSHAQQQLTRWQLLDADGKITAAGTQVSQLGTHPRVAVLLQSVVNRSNNSVAAEALQLALALHFEWPAEDDLSAWLHDAAQELEHNKHWRLQRKRWLTVLNVHAAEGALVAEQLAPAFTDRIGYRQDSGRYRLNSGISVAPLHKLDCSWAIFLDIQPRAKGHTGVALALSLTQAQQRELSQVQSTLVFKQNQWHAQRTWLMGGVVVAEEIAPLAAGDVSARLLDHLHTLFAAQGLTHLPWPVAARRLLQRARLVAQHQMLELPPLDDDSLIARLDQWLQPFLTAHTRLDDLPWLAGLEFYLGYEVCQRINAIVPHKITLPSGREIYVEFSREGVPEIAAKLQEFFGCDELQLAKGKIPLRIHLLSPNGSPLAITTDLRSFWQQGYPDVRKEMRGRYPRHPWPDEPQQHIATALTKRRLANLPPK